MDFPTEYHTLIIKGVYNIKKTQLGWRLVALWGDEEKGEGTRFGPVFPESQLAEYERLADELEKKYGLPISWNALFSHFSGIEVGDKLDTTDGMGVVHEIRPGILPILVRLESGGWAWQNQSNIIKIIK